MNRFSFPPTKPFTRFCVEPLEERRVLSANFLSQLHVPETLSTVAEVVNEVVPEPIQQTENALGTTLGLNEDLSIHVEQNSVADGQWNVNLSELKVSTKIDSAMLSLDTEVQLDTSPTTISPIPSVKIHSKMKIGPKGFIPPGLQKKIDAKIEVGDETNGDIEIEVPNPDLGGEGENENPPTTGENGGSETGSPSPDLFFQHLNSSQGLSVSAFQQQQLASDVSLQVFLLLQSMNDSELTSGSNEELLQETDSEIESVLLGTILSENESLLGSFNSTEEGGSQAELEQQLAQQYGVEILRVIQEGAVLPSSGNSLAMGNNGVVLAGATTDVGAIDQALSAFLQDLDALVGTLKDWLLQLGPLPWIVMGLAVTMTTATIARQRWRKLRQQRKDRDELALLSNPGWPI